TPHTKAAISARPRSPGPRLVLAARAPVAGRSLATSPSRSGSASSVGKVARAGEVQRDAGGLRGGDNLLVPDRPARGDDRTHPGLEQDLQAIGEGEERVRGTNRASGPLRAGPLHRETAGVDAVDLAHADAHAGTVASQQDGVGLYRAHRAPRERQVAE